MPEYIANITRWKERAKIDFFTEFVKAWIPFNAWYNQSYSNANSDREIINEIKFDSCVKTKIKRLLEGSDDTSNEFKSFIAKFHRILEELELKNNGFNVNFTSVVVEKNDYNNDKFEYRGIKYQSLFDRSQNKYIATITNAARTKIFNYIHDKYNYNHFESEVEQCNISANQKGYIKEYFKKINPYIPINLITSDNEYIEIGNYKYVNNTDLISKAIIENLYSLRCMLFHGSIEPTQDTEVLYESAYYILKHILEAIN